MCIPLHVCLFVCLCVNLPVIKTIYKVIFLILLFFLFWTPQMELEINWESLNSKLLLYPSYFSSCSLVPQI